MHFIARRAMVAAAAAASLMSPTARPAIAIEQTTIVASGTVQLQSGAAAVGADAPGAALYVTAKPVDGGTGITAQAGKTPPLAAARYSTPISFPFDWKLSAADLTPEFASVDPSVWELSDLTITARFDTDGVAATRGPDDLVGRGRLTKRGAPDESQWTAAVVELQGRGLTGRLLTGGK